MKQATAGLLAVPALGWLGTLWMAYPQRSTDHEGIAIFLAVLLGPPLFILIAGRLLKMQIEVDVRTHAFEPWHEPEKRFFVINAAGQTIRTVIAVALGALGYKLLPFIDLPMAGPLLGVACLCILLLDYQDVLDLQQAARITRVAVGVGSLAAPVWVRSLEIASPYQLHWVYRYESGRYGGWKLKLQSSQLPNPLDRLGAGRSLTTLNEIGEKFASWRNGRIFAYEPLPDLPRRPGT